MDILITAIACLVVGVLLGALIVTHPIAAKRAITIPQGDIDWLKEKLGLNKPTP